MESALGAPGATAAQFAALGTQHAALSAEIETLETQWLDMSLAIESQA